MIQYTFTDYSSEAVRTGQLPNNLTTVPKGRPPLKLPRRQYERQRRQELQQQLPRSPPPSASTTTTTTSAAAANEPAGSGLILLGPTAGCPHRPFLPPTEIDHPCPICLPPIRTHNVPIREYRRKGKRPNPQATVTPSPTTVREIIEKWPQTMEAYQRGLICRSTFYERNRIYQRWREMGNEAFWQVYEGLSTAATLHRIQGDHHHHGDGESNGMDRLLAAIEKENSFPV